MPHKSLDSTPYPAGCCTISEHTVISCLFHGFRRIDQYYDTGDEITNEAAVLNKCHTLDNL